MEKTEKHHVRKVYCSKCDLLFNSREKFDKHFERHSSSTFDESCPVDTVIGKFVNLFKRKSRNNLE